MARLQTVAATCLSGKRSAKERMVLVLKERKISDCESEYNRGAGCGKTARPDLSGGYRVTGISAVNMMETKHGNGR